MNRISMIYLDAFNLTGTFPIEAIQLLPELRSLSLKSNNLYVSLPPLLTDTSDNTHPQLIHFNLAENYFIIPTALWNVSTDHPLEMLDLSFNQFQDAEYGLSSQIGLFSNLTHLYCVQCRIKGTLPEELYQLKHLEHLVLQAHDALAGTLATKDGLLTKFQFLSVGNTALSGTLPTETGLCSFLLELDLWGTMLSGTIPEELMSNDMLYLNALILGNSQFTGSISSNIATMPRLGYLI